MPRLVRIALVVAVTAAVAPVAARADRRPAGVTLVRSGPLIVRVQHEPFALEVIQGRRVVLRSARDPLDPTGATSSLAFAVGPSVAAQTPMASYGITTDALRWIGATSATPTGKGRLRVATDDPGRSFDVTVRSVRPGVVELDARLSDPRGVSATGAAFGRSGDERFLGFGERSEAVDQTGRVVENWNEEGPFSAGGMRPYTDPVTGEDWQGPPPVGPASNYTMPWFVARSGYGFLLHSTWLNRFHLDGASSWRVEHADPGRLRFRLYGGPSPGEVLNRFTADREVGRQPEPAPWYFGPWYQPTGEADFRRSLVPRWRDADVPVTVAQTYTHYLPCAAHAGRAKDEQELTALYHQWGYKVTTYVNSFVCESHPEGAYAEGDSQGFFVKTAAGSTYPIPYAAYLNSSSAVVDFSAPGAAAWWHGLIDDALVNGYDGWMEDFGEYVPPDARLHDGRTGLEAHNAYCTDYHRASHALTWVREGRPDFAQFVRCGYLGTAPYARIVWGGDPTEDDSEADGLAAVVHQGLSMGLSGIAYWGSDIGGFHSLFTSERTQAELLVRWLQLGAFSGIMRTQAEGYERPDQSGEHRAEVWDDDVLPHWRRLSELRTQLFPYIWEAAAEYRRSGVPLMRHLTLAYPTSPAAWGDGPAAGGARFEFLFGPDLLVAPVVDLGATSRPVWLPPGQWVDLWDMLVFDEATGELRADPAGHTVLDGDKVIDVDAPLDRIPVFVRAGACLPLLPGDVDTLVSDRGFEHDADVVTLAERAHAVRRIGAGTSC
jgi:alpha-glucosidase (family GH31 glycosyl hydrolase)